MNIFAALDDDRKLRRFLFWYWLLVPFALFAWILLGAANSNMTFQQALNIPFFAVAFLNGCLTILLAGLFKLAGSENERTERVFTLYALAVQIVVGNLPGALACYLLLRATRDGGETEKFAPSSRCVLSSTVGFVGMVRRQVLAANTRLRTR